MNRLKNIRFGFPVAMSLLSAVLFSAAWLGGSGLPLFLAFVPLLILQKRNTRGLAWWVMLTMLVWIMATTWWVGKSTLIATFAVPIVGLVFSWLPFMIYHFVWKRAPRALAYTVFVTVWIVFEKLYMLTDVSFPWLMLGNGFAEDPMLIQWYSITGAFGGSLWVLIANILYFELWSVWSRGGGRIAVRDWLPVFVWLVVPMIVSLAMYYSYDEQVSFAASTQSTQQAQSTQSAVRNVEVTIVQPNIDPYNEKFKKLSQRDQLNIILNLAARAPQNVDYIITPETAVDNNLWLDNIEQAGVVKNIRTLLHDKYPAATLVLGATTLLEVSDAQIEANPRSSIRRVKGFNYEVFNSALWIDTSSIVDVYHKSKLVIGAESTPAIFSRMSLDLGGVSGNLGRQAERSVYQHAVPTGTAICYESIYGEYFAQYVKNGAQIMFIITNDGWWGNTAGHRQHLSYARLRAIETRRAIARSANTGISAFINPRGDIQQEIGWWERGAISARMVPRDDLTVYVRWGDIIARISGYVLALSLLYFISYTFRKKQ